MRSHPFFQEATKSAVTSAVKDIEAKTSAEVVVSVRAQSDAYRDVDILAGFALAMFTLAFLIYAPMAFDENLMPLETLVAFVVGSLAVSKIGALKQKFPAIYKG